MRNLYIFGIPVYLCPENAYHAQMEAEASRDLASIEFPRGETPDAPWDFNQVVGWIRLFADESRIIGGHLWWVNARKIFYLNSPSDILAAHITQKDSEKIFEEVLAQIERIAKEPPFKGHYVDLRTFRNAGRFINWRKLLDEAASDYPSFRMDNTEGWDAETLNAMNQELARRLGLSGPHELESLIGGEHYHPIIESIMARYSKFKLEDEDYKYTQNDYN
jgi:hypothetical protein